MTIWFVKQAHCSGEIILNTKKIKSKISNIYFEYTNLSIQKRLLASVLAVTFIFLLLCFRIFYICVLKTNNLQIKAQEQWTRSLYLKANRGLITDVNGTVLAENIVSYDIFLRAREIENAVSVSKYLSNILNLNFEKTYEKAKDVYTSEVLLKLQVDQKTALEIINKNYKGVYVTENISRNYPYGKLLSQVIGFLTSDSIGQSGLENFYNKILCGVDGKYLTQSDVRGLSLNNSLNYYIEGIDGLNITLNIDINIQNIVENVLEQVMEEQKPKRVSCIILNPNNSKVLAMAINPSFNLNNVPREDVTTLLDLTKNISVTDVYEPGSTFKILTLAAALSEGLTNINERFYCPGFRIIDGERIKCWRTIGHGSQTLVECVQNSCNCCFMDLALRLGKEKLYKYLTAFGIGKTTGIDISGESGGLLLNKDVVKNVDLARIGFGQSVAVSQIQLLNAFCAAINGGVLHVPSVVGGYCNNEGDIVYSNKNLITNQVLTPEVSNTIRFLLEQSLSKAGEMTFINNYKVAGKTGTAQKYGEDKKIAQGKYVSSFFGFLNGSTKPEYALMLCVDEPSSGAYYGSVVAKPYAKVIFEKIIEYKNIEKNSQNGAIKKVTMPNLVGKSLSYACGVLNELNVDFEIDGDKGVVLWQFPKADTEIEISSSIILKT